MVFSVHMDCHSFQIPKGLPRFYRSIRSERFRLSCVLTVSIDVWQTTVIEFVFPSSWVVNDKVKIAVKLCQERGMEGRKHLHAGD